MQVRGWRRRRDSSRRRRLRKFVAIGLVFVSANVALRIPAVDDRVSSAVATAGRPFAPDNAVLTPLPESSVAVAADGVSLGYLDASSRRRVVRLDEVPMLMRHAVLAAEDARFFHHEGLDPASVQRALALGALGRPLKGTSTLTQQLAKLNFTDGRRTWRRKVRELSYANELERRYSKRELLEHYLNQVYFGDGVHGIAAASEEYFGVSPAQLSVAQAAMLAGKIHSPDNLDPRDKPDAVKGRRDQVLRLMRRRGWLGETELRDALATPIAVVGGRASDEPTVRSAVRRVRDELLSLPQLGPDRAARERALSTNRYRIETTLRGDSFGVVHRRATALLDGAALEPSTEMGAVAIEPGTGAVRVLVGAVDRNDFDFASHGWRPPGSTLEPVLYVAAVRAGLARVGPGPSVAVDCRQPVPHVSCPWPGKVVSLDDALASGNTLVFDAIRNALPPAVIAETAARLGLRGPAPAACDRPAGPLDGASPFALATVYAAIASGGVAAPPYFVQRVVDRDGHVVYEHTPSASRVLGADAAAALTSALARRPAAGETRGNGIDSASPDGANAWSARVTPQVAAASWIGDADSETPLVSGPASGELANLVSLPSRVTGAAVAAATPVDADTGPAPATPSLQPIASRRAAATSARSGVALDVQVAEVLRDSTAGAVSALVQIDDDVVVDIGGDRPMVPASTQKLFTAGAALLQLDADDRLVTDVRATSVPIAGTVDGDLVLVAGGDPGLRGRDLDRLAAEVAAGGVRHITGGVSVDDTRFDRERARPGWAWQDMAWEVGPLSPLVVDGNQWRCDAAFLRDPATAGGELLRDALRAQGVRVDRNAVALAGAPSGAPTLARHRSRSVGALVGRVLRDSDSLAAELLLKEVGRRHEVGSTDGGARAIAQLVPSITGSDTPAAVPIDGSGMSRLGRQTARAEVAWLLGMRRSRVGRRFESALPVACRSGTLARRLCGTAAEGRVMAKTGTLSDAVALAGYAPVGERTATFSIMLNDVTSIPEARRAIDRAVVLMTTYAGAGGRSGAAGSAEAVPSRRSALVSVPPSDGVPDAPEVALTFDDGPSPFTLPMIDVLRRYNASATFFMVGERAARHPEIVQAVARAGFSVQHHTYTHRDLTQLDGAAVAAEVDQGNTAITGLTGRKVTCLRPPFGKVNRAVDDVLARRGLTAAMWSVDPWDWAQPDVDTLVANVLDRVQPGSIVLLHDGGGDRSRTVAALPAILDGLRARGYRTVSLCTR